jgi:hypothetical protein
MSTADTPHVQSATAPVSQRQALESSPRKRSKHAGHGSWEHAGARSELNGAPECLWRSPAKHPPQTKADRRETTDECPLRPKRQPSRAIGLPIICALAGPRHKSREACVGGVCVCVRTPARRTAARCVACVTSARAAFDDRCLDDRRTHFDLL